MEQKQIDKIKARCEAAAIVGMTDNKIVLQLIEYIEQLQKQVNCLIIMGYEQEKEIISSKTEND